MGHRLRRRAPSTAPRAGPRRSDAGPARRARAGSGTGRAISLLVVLVRDQQPVRPGPPAAAAARRRTRRRRRAARPAARRRRRSPPGRTGAAPGRPPRPDRVGAEHGVRVVVGAGEQPARSPAERATGARPSPPAAGAAGGVRPRLGAAGAALGAVAAASAAVHRGRGCGRLAPRLSGRRLLAVLRALRDGLRAVTGASRRVGGRRAGRTAGAAECSGRGGGQALDRGHRDGQPVGAVPGLVQRPRTPPCPSRRRAAAPGSSRGSRPAAARSPRSRRPGSGPPSPGATGGASGPRSRRSAACPATSRTGGCGRRRSASGRDGSPSKSISDHSPAGARRHCPRCRSPWMRWAVQVRPSAARSASASKAVRSAGRVRPQRGHRLRGGLQPLGHRRRQRPGLRRGPGRPWAGPRPARCAPRRWPGPARAPRR